MRSFLLIFMTIAALPAFRLANLNFLRESLTLWGISTGLEPGYGQIKTRGARQDMRLQTMIMIVSQNVYALIKVRRESADLPLEIVTTRTYPVNMWAWQCLI